VKQERLIQKTVGMLPTAVTLAALVSGLLSIYASMLGAAGGADAIRHQLHAALLIMLAMILDGIDGNLARLLKATSDLGAELDTFVDLTAFGLAPAFLLYASATGFPPAWRIALGCALVLSGAFRLARFKVVDPFRGQHGFLGLPITVCAAAVALLHIVAIQSPDSWGPLKMNLHSGPLAAALLGIVALLALLQVSHVRFSKPTKNPLIFVPALVLVALLLSGSPALSSISALILLACGFFYLATAPFLQGPAPDAAAKE
jgi:CDP-diacylglycerol--serine O-phosphatidyltransferase